MCGARFRLVPACLVACAAVVLAGALVGCSGPVDLVSHLLGGGEVGEKYVSPRQQSCLNAVDALVSALDEGDADAIAGLFSPNVRASVEGLEDGARELVELRSAPVTYVNRDSAARPVERERVDDHRRRVELEANFSLALGEQNLWVYLTLVSEDDFDEGEVGVNSLAVFSEDFYCAMIHDLPDAIYSIEPGLRVYRDYPLEWETRVVDDEPLRYEEGTAVLDVTEVTAFLDEAPRTVADFEVRFGRPCCVSWMGGGTVYYELPLEDGEPRYLEVNAATEGEPVFAAYSVDERGVVALVWDADEANDA